MVSNQLFLGPEWHLPSDMASSPATLSGLHDCRSALRQAIDESESVNNAFIPECDEFGNFQPAQCYKVSTLYSIENGNTMYLLGLF